MDGELRSSNVGSEREMAFNHIRNGEPLYLQSSDHPGMILVSTLVTGNNNYLSWSCMKIVLGAKVKLGFVNGKCEMSGEESPNFEQWNRVDFMVTSWILNSISKEIVEAFPYTTSAREIEESCAVAKLVADMTSSNRLMQFLMGLNENFDHIRNQILVMDPLPSVNKAYSMVLRVEKQREETPSEVLGEQLSKGIEWNNALSELIKQELTRFMKGKAPADGSAINFAHFADFANHSSTSFDPNLSTSIDHSSNNSLADSSSHFHSISSHSLAPTTNIESSSSTPVITPLRHSFRISKKHAWLDDFVSSVPVHQLDINNAFLHGHLDEEVYILPPDGYTKATKDQVCRLKRSLYGLKQASRQWNNEFTFHLIAYGFSQSAHDHYLFIKSTTSSFLTLLVYVDDVIITSSSKDDIQAVKVFLHDKFTIKDLGYAKYFQGVEIARSSHGSYIYQRKYTLDILQAARLSGVKPAFTPLPKGFKFSATSDDFLSKPDKYRRLVGRLLYLGFIDQILLMLFNN
ncbi:uncharacterized protein LOC116118244 [Pistacia vera]|uniref:uncharacterized protein LOC116118244 n=1 Tax=Pistacia vera TaxID=55513 RepID=UPI00126304FC|nr:uncharacterized protein LOC116118244 [Pistacia vera]